MHSAVVPGHRNREGDWFKVAVIDSVGPPKRVYRLGHNGELFAKSKEFKLLAERFREAVPVIEAATFGESQASDGRGPKDRP
jgi:hypothetical protein